MAEPLVKGRQLVRSATTRRILKAMSVFGSVQFIQVLCSIVRTKLVAIWIGPVGVGLLAIYNSVMEFLMNTSQLNIRQSAVRDLSLAVGDTEEFKHIVYVVRKLSFWLGIVGMIIVIACSPLLGYISFGDTGHALPFVILSPMLLLSALASGDWAVMQGGGLLKKLAQSNLFAVVTSTVVAIPLFYYLRIKAIVPVLLLYTACNCLYAYLFSRHVRVKAQPLRQILSKGRGMLALGLYLTISAGVTLLASYIFIVYLNRKDSESAVGIYQAGYTLVNSYVGMIFTAIAMEYYPRLSSIIAHRSRAEVIVNHEIKIVLLAMLPVTVAFICARNLIVEILYSSDFSDVLPYISVAILGISFRAVSWCLAFSMLAKGDGPVYIITETISAVLYIIINIGMYNPWGFAGLGAGYVLWYALYALSTWLVFRYRYGMRLQKAIVALMFAVPSVGVISLVCEYFVGVWLTALFLLTPTLWLGIKAIIRR